jgi:hypothetical protein
MARPPSGIVALAVILGGGCGEEPGAAAPPPGDGTPCPLTAMDASGACWERAAPPGSGAFPGEWRPGKFPLGLVPIRAFRDELWMLAQAMAWSSGDGLSWAQQRKDDWGSRIGQAYVFFRGELWMSGGLEYDSRSFLRDLWRSTDGARWQRAGEAAWPAREGHTVVAFRDKLWLFGGAVHVAADRSPDGFVNDVWSSEDGVAWTQVTAAAPWPVMDSPRVLVFQDALFLLGGQGHAGVWRSPDGVSWTSLSPAPAWGARYDQGMTLFAGRLWVFGGEPAPRQVRRPGVAVQALNDIWYSADGVTWLPQAEHGPWSPRSGGTSVVFQDKLWLFSGKHTGSPDNWGGDIWTMQVVQR